MTIRAIIFDMDGVLIDAREWHYHALNKALSPFGYTITRHDHLVTYDGLPTRKKLEMLSLEKGLPKELHSFINEMKQIYTEETIYQSCHPVFQHEYALSRLRAENFRLAVCSNSISSTVEKMISRAGLLKYLEFCLSNEDVQRAKPDPEIYTTAIKRMELDPRECLVVEDNANGIQAAEAAGAHVLAVESPDDVHYEAIINEIERLGRGVSSV